MFTIRSGNHVQFLANHHSSGKIGVWYQGSNRFYSDNVVTSGEPHHVAIWYDSASNTTHLMVDGIIQQANYTGNLLNISNPDVMIGAYSWYGTYYSGMLGEVDEVAVYDGSVSANTFAGRMTVGSNSSPVVSYAYDANGNRISVDDGSATTNYSYQALSNERTAIGASSITRDLAGNRTADQGGNRTFAYNNAGRLTEVSVSSSVVADYVYNSLGQRTRKNTTSNNIVYLYDLSGNLIAEHDQTGTHIRDYVWMNGMPVAQIEAGETFRYIHGDHLNTPRLATNDSQTVVWRWDSDAFGTTAANDDPDGDSTATEINLRFPGQYFDAETGLHYNYFRTYDPSTGRYLESDPIGLEAGIDTYGYVSANPLSLIDPFGLVEFKELFECLAGSEGVSVRGCFEDLGKKSVTEHAGAAKQVLTELKDGSVQCGECVAKCAFITAVGGTPEEILLTVGEQAAERKTLAMIELALGASAKAAIKGAIDRVAAPVSAHQFVSCTLDCDL